MRGEGDHGGVSARVRGRSTYGGWARAVSRRRDPDRPATRSTEPTGRPSPMRSAAHRRGPSSARGVRIQRRAGSAGPACHGGETRWGKRRTTGRAGCCWSSWITDYRGEASLQLQWWWYWCPSRIDENSAAKYVYCATPSVPNYKSFQKS